MHAFFAYVHCAGLILNMLNKKFITLTIFNKIWYKVHVTGSLTIFKWYTVVHVKLCNGSYGEGNDQIMVFINRVILDKDTSIFLDNVRMTDCKDLGIACTYHKVMQNSTYNWRLKNELYYAKLAEGANPIKLEDDIPHIKIMFLTQSNIIITIVHALFVKQKATINDSTLKSNIHSIQLRLELLVTNPGKNTK